MPVYRPIAAVVPSTNKLLNRPRILLSWCCRQNSACGLYTCHGDFFTDTASATIWSSTSWKNCCLYLLPGGNSVQLASRKQVIVSRWAPPSGCNNPAIGIDHRGRPIRHWLRCVCSSNLCIFPQLQCRYGVCYRSSDYGICEGNQTADTRKDRSQHAKTNVASHQGTFIAQRLKVKK